MLSSLTTSTILSYGTLPDGRSSPMILMIAFNLALMPWFCHVCDVDQCKFRNCECLFVDASLPGDDTKMFVLVLVHVNVRFVS